MDLKIERFEREITPVIVDSAGQIVWIAGLALAEEFRVTDGHKRRGNLETVTYLVVGGYRVNSTLKSLVFWMVLVVVALGVWNFSNRLQTPSKLVPFSDFMADVEAGKIERVTITGQEISGIYRADKETFHTYAPPQYKVSPIS